MPKLTLDPNAGLQFHALTGPDFENARYGTRDSAHQLTAPAWLLSPTLKYFHDRSVLEHGPDTRVFFMATRPCDSLVVRNKREAVAMLEIAAQPHAEHTVGIKYVSVLETCRQTGLALQLYRSLVEHLRAHALRLYRTRPGAETPPQFTAAVTRLLDQHQVDWYQREPASSP